MCIIVDASCLHHVSNFTECGLPVIKWLLNPKKPPGSLSAGNYMTNCGDLASNEKRRRNFMRPSRSLTGQDVCTNLRDQKSRRRQRSYRRKEFALTIHTSSLSR